MPGPATAVRARALRVVPACLRVDAVDAHDPLVALAADERFPVAFQPMCTSPTCRLIDRWYIDDRRRDSELLVEAEILTSDQLSVGDRRWRRWDSNPRLPACKADSAIFAGLGKRQIPGPDRYPQSAWCRSVRLVPLRCGTFVARRALGGCSTR